MQSSAFSRPFFPSLYFFFNDTATTEIYTLSLHDALPISSGITTASNNLQAATFATNSGKHMLSAGDVRSEEHTSELQSQSNLVCRLLLEKKKGIEPLVLAQESHLTQDAAVDHGVDPGARA